MRIIEDMSDLWIVLDLKGFLGCLWWYDVLFGRPELTL